MACIGPAGVVRALAPHGTTTYKANVTRTCRHFCGGTEPDTKAPGEVFGPNSRCFAARVPPPTGDNEIHYECVEVMCSSSSCHDDSGFRDEKGYRCHAWKGFDCARAVERWGYTQAGEDDVIANCPKTCNGCGYVVKLSDGATVTCDMSGSYKSFHGWLGEVFCDIKSEVCTDDGQVMRTWEEKRRGNISEYLDNMFGDATARDLLAYYDKGDFEAHPPIEDGIDGEFVIDYGSSTCDWANTALAALERVEMPMLNFTLFKGVDGAALLDAIQSGCAVVTEQAMLVRAESYAATENAAWGIDSLDNTVDSIYRRYWGGEGVKVFVLDTGIDADHEELVGRVDAGADFTGSPSGTDDRQGHGTHCAGTIAGTNVGVAPLATVVPVKVLDDDGMSTGSSVFEGLQWVLEQKLACPPSETCPMVASGSLGGARSNMLNRAWRALVAVGVTAVVAAGNTDEYAFFHSPASEPSVITVGAIDNKQEPADFSNYGEQLDIWAPGVNIYSARAGGGMRYMSGTSMACPHVAGVAALVLEYDPSRSHEEVEQELLSDCGLDIGMMKSSTGLILRTNAAPPPTGNLSSVCGLAGGDPGPSPAPGSSPGPVVNVASEDDAGNDDDGLPLGAIVAIVLLAVAIVVIAVLIVLRKTKTFGFGKARSSGARPVIVQAQVVET